MCLEDLWQLVSLGSSFLQASLIEEFLLKQSSSWKEKKKKKKDLFLGGIEGVLERREIGVEEAGEKVPVGKGVR